MFRVDNTRKSITMNEGDFGLTVSFTFDEIEDNSNFIFKVYDSEDVILEKNINNINETKLNLIFTQKESEKLTKGFYKWSLLQYVDNSLKNTIVKDSIFEVKAGA